MTSDKNVCRRKGRKETMIVQYSTPTHLCIENEIGALHTVRWENFERDYEWV